MAGQGISVPISLQISNLQAIINEIQSKMSNLKVGSGGFRALETSLKYLQKELDSLQVQAQKPFMTENQFSSAQKSVTRLEDEFNNLQLKVNRIKFSDLNLNPDQQAQLKALQDEVVAIQNSLKSLKETAKQEFLGSDLGKVWQEIDPTASTKSLDQITSNIRRAVLDQKELADQAKEAWQDYAKATSLSDTVEKALKTKNPLENLMSAKEYNSFFSENKNGVLSFKSGQKPVFEQWLIDNLQVDPNIAHNLVQQSANQIREELKNAQSAIRAELNTKIKPTARTDESTAKTDYDKQSASLLQLQDILNRVAAAYLNIDTNSANLKQRLAENGISADKLRESFVQAAQAELSLGNNAKTVNTNLDILKTTLDSTNAALLRQQRVAQSFNSMKMAVVNFMGFNQVLNITRRAVREAINHIKELDTVMNGIAIVTDMSTGDLWTQIDQYSKMAQAYGVSITGAYEVSQIYYQQGLETADVMTLTNETLKLAKISGLDYATTTDYMTTAIRGFKMEMSEASTVVDVYSNLAAHTAVSQEELAVAMSKTASSMEGVGATFEEASAMIGTMVAVTRESATNIGSAMKSIASRYGELTKDPTKLVDEEGEAMAFNKVDAALQSVGISMRTVDGQFREFTDVIVELGEKWDQLDSTQQRYIATQFAGNRQQSRFLALVGNVDLLKSNLDVAMNSEDTGTLQALKALDSIESKIEQVKVAYQQFYTTIGVESVWKGLLDSTKEVINTLNGLPKLFGKIPVGAIAVVYDIINLIKGALTHGLTAIADVVLNHLHDTTNEVENAGNKMRPAGENFFDKFIAGMTSRYSALKEAAEKGVEEANQAAVQKAKEEREAKKSSYIAQQNRNNDQIQNNESEIARLTSYISTPADADTENWQVESLQRLGLTAEDARNKIQALEQANVQLNQANKELQVSIDAETNAENNNSNAKERNALKTKEGTTAALKYAASHHQLSQSTSAIASGLNMVATMIGTSSRAAQVASGAFMMFGGALRGFGAIFEYIKNLGTSAQTAFPWMAAIMAGISLINGISQMWETDEERIERLTKEAEDLNNAAKEAKANYKTLDNSVKKLDELREKRYESTEAAEEYQTAVDELADKFPQMIAGFDAAGNIILDTTNAEELLTRAREKSAKAAFEASEAELKAQREKTKQAFNKISGELLNGGEGDDEVVSSSYEKLWNYMTDVGKQTQMPDLFGSMAESLIQTSNLTDALNLFYTYYQGYKQSVPENQQEQDKFLSNFKFLEHGQNSAGQFSADLLQSYFSNNAEPLTGPIQQFYDTFFNPAALAIDAFTNATREYNNLSKDVDLDTRLAAFKKVRETFQKAKDLKAFSEDVDIEAIEESLGAVGDAVGEYEDQLQITAGMRKSTISLWQQTQTNNGEAWQYLEDSAAAAALVTNQINRDWDEWEKAKKQTFEVNDTNYGIISKEDYITQMEDFWINLNDDQKKLFDSMFEDSQYYTQEDFSEVFGQIKGFKEIEPLLTSYYANSAENIAKRLNNRLSQVLGNKPDENGEYADIWYADVKDSPFAREFAYVTNKGNSTGERTQAEERYLNSILDQYENLRDDGYKRRAESFGWNAMQLFKSINNAPAEIEKQLWNLVEENGLNTIEGIEKIKTTIANNSELSSYVNTDILDTLQNNIIPNISLAIQTATSDLLENWESTSKELSSAMSGGVSLKDADALINKAKNLGLDFSLQDFQLVGDKLILINQSFDEYYKALIASTTSIAADWSTRIQNASALLEEHKNDKSTWQYTEDERALLQSIGFDLTNPEYMKYGELTITGIQALEQAIQQSQNNLTNYNTSAQIAAKQLARSYNWSQGNYFDYEIVGEDGTTQIYKSIVHNVKDIQNKIAEDRNSRFGKNTEERAMLDNIYSAYDTLISDVFSKGIKNIHLDDYEGLIDVDNANLQAILQEGSYQNFINEYAKFAGKSIDETNELLAQAIEKEQEKTSSEVLSNLQFINQNQFTASLSDLTELANRFDIELSDLTTNWSQALGAYIVDITTIDAFKNFTGVENYQAIINDSINEFFSNLVNLIKSALSGSLSNADRGQLDQWVADYNEKFGANLKLDFTKTAEGLKLSNDSAWDLVQALREVDALQSNIVFDALKESLIETDDRFKSVSTTAARITELTRSVRGATITKNNGRVDAFDQLNGNVDMYNRPQIDMGNGDYATVLTSTLDSRNYVSNIPWVMNVTPIPPDASTVEDILSDSDMDAYIQGILDQNPINGDAILELDKIENGGKGLIVDLKEVSEVTDETVESMAEGADTLHEMSEVYEAIKDGEVFDSTKIEQYEEELALLKEIQLTRATSEDSSFKFMDGAIPVAQNNPLNYYENWGKAWSTITTAGKKGYMAYQDFYNIVTEMNNIAGISGQEIELAGITLNGKMERAAALIDKGAASLSVTADGSIKVDLSKMGIDFAAGADGLAENVDAGIKEMAQSQIDMLDGLISLLETIVAMESLSDIDVKGDGIDLTDIFTVEYDETGAVKAITGFADKYTTWRKTIRDQITEGSDNFNKDLADAMSKITIDGNSLADMINWNWSDFNPDSAQTFSATMAALYSAAISNNYDLDNIADSVKEVLIASGVNNLTIDIGDTSLVIAGGQITQINWKSDDSKSVMDKVRASCEEYKNKTDAEIHQIITETMQKYQNGDNLTQEELEWTVEMNHHLKMINGQKTVEWNGTQYGAGKPGYQAALAALRAEDATGVDLNRDLTKEEIETGTITTTATIGSKTNIKVVSDGTTITFSSSEFPGEYHSQEELTQAHYRWYQEQVKASTPDHQYHGSSYEEWLYTNYDIRVKVQTNITGTDGNPVDLTTDVDTRQKIKDLISQSDEDIKAMVEAGADGQGNYQVELDNGVVVTFSGDDITVDGEVNTDLIKQQMASALGLDSALADTITLGIKNAFGEDGIPLENLKITPQNTTVDGEVEVQPIDTATGEVVNLKVTAQNTEAEGAITDAQISAMLENATVEIGIDKETAVKDLDEVAKKAQEVEENDPQVAVSADTQAAAQQLDGIIKQLSQINSKEISIHTTYTETGTPPKITGTSPQEKNAEEKSSGATGNIGLAKAQGTLMGELGPELVVSNGRYFVAGQNGPEMVDLADDAIVFNHLQTKSLLEKGTSSGRGKAVTNERNAVAFATGNINGGPAMASASAALAALKQLRSMWQSLLGSSVKDLAGAGGGGGGGGGGNDAAKDPAFVKDLEKWYNWLQRIAVLEEKINYEEAKRNKIASDMIAHGQDYAKSLLESFNYLKEQTAVHQSLADSQQVYFNQRREQMNSASNPFSALYTFDEYGQLKYKNGALAQLSEIISRDQLTGKGTYTASEQYAILKNNGFERYMQYDSSGNEIDRSQEGWETNAIQAFWDKIDADKEEMQSLHDSIEEHKKAVLEDQEKANEILKEIEDNQISVEDRVLKAIEDTRQREIDELQKQRDAIEESANNLINGLSEQLNREKDMYSQQASQDELTRLQRQLGILQNSGGSASQIASLQKEIGQKQQDAYFEAQQRQIDTLQQASQNELERLDRQIDLMTESLEYEKENGLLWGAVYEVMAGTPEQITSFITEHDSQYWGVSPTQLTQDTRDILFEAQQFVTYRQEMKDGITGMIDAFNSYKVETEKQLEDTRKLAMDTSGANSGSAKKDTGGGSGGSPGGASKSSSGKKEVSTSYIDAGSSGHKVHVAYSDGTSSEKLEAHNWDKKVITGGTKTCYCSKCNHYMGIVYPGDAHFSQGGMIDYTGPAMVHGSKSKPESVLNAEQTKILRDNILSNKPNSLISLLQTYNNGYDANALIPATKEGVIIEQATVEMHVAQIANDYDASRAGEQALEKIMAIARKSQGSTRIGR